MIVDNIRDIEEFKNLYKKCDGVNRLRKIHHILDIFKHKFGFCFYNENDNKLEGCIYVEKIKDKVFLSGFSIRKHLKENIEAVNYVCDWLKQDVYSETPYKYAIMVLKGAGFEHYKKNIYIRRFKNGR